MLRGPRQSPRTGSGTPLPGANGARRTAVPTSRPYALPVPYASSATQWAADRAGPAAVSAVTRRTRQALASRRADASTIHAAANSWHVALRTFPGEPAGTRLPGAPGLLFASGIMLPSVRVGDATGRLPGHICDL